ncbi:MAG: hypothetical protein GC204_17115 [Chloroflexi bacterium]|nr:hypothetical protein [Chloroflexota bacterium]
MLKRLFWLALALTVLAACTTPRGLQPGDIPTRASINDLSTSIPLTENAPPTPFNNTQTGFTSVDNGLNDLSGWRYVVQLNFTGVFADTPRQANATAQAEVSFNQLASARHVIVTTSGELIGQTGDTSYEAVRLGPDAFLVRGGTCYQANDDAKTAADLRAGQLVGGVSRATPGGKRATINGQDVYFYTFDAGDLVLPSIRIGDNGQVNMTSGEMWISPAHNAVVRFYLNLDVTNVVLFDRQLPVTGQVTMRYDLYDIGSSFNITTPFGC